MSVWVRYKPMDLMDAEEQVYVEAQGYRIMEDDTLILLTINEETGEARPVGAVRRDRWDAVLALEPAD